MSYPFQTNPSQFDYQQLAGEASGILRMMGMPAVIRRRNPDGTSTDYWCRVFIRRWKAIEMMGRMINPLERSCLIAAQGLQITPTPEVDRLVTFIQPIVNVPVEDENLRIVSQPEAIKPAGVLLAWKTTVRR